MKPSDFMVSPGTKVKLKGIKTASKADFKKKKIAKRFLDRCAQEIAQLQNMLFAQKNHGVLIIFQAMDAAGKDSNIRKVFAYVDPHGCSVKSFGRPSDEELAHDYMWRHVPALPKRGHISIFNRSYYEEVLVVRVHPDVLAKQNLPAESLKDVWKRRYDEINAFEKYLSSNGITVIKIFLHVSRDEQKLRFIERIARKEKNYKFSSGDVKERDHWDVYQSANEEMLSATSTKNAPWYIIPADQKWFSRAIISDIVRKRLKMLKPKYPTMIREKRKELLVLKDDLKHEKETKKRSGKKK